jgi:uncharacterized OsmC-like protein
MSRNLSPIPPLLAAAVALAGCSVDDLRGRAEAVRVQAEGIGAQIEEARSDQLLAEGGGGFETVRPPIELEASPAPEEKAGQAKAAPRQQNQPPVVVYLPAQ